MSPASRKRQKRAESWRLDWIGRLFLFLMLVVFMGGVCFAEQRASRRLKRAVIPDTISDTIGRRPDAPDMRR